MKKFIKIHVKECGLVVAAKIKQLLIEEGFQVIEEWDYGSSDVILCVKEPAQEPAPAELF